MPTVWRLLVGEFEKKIKMRVTTVASDGQLPKKLISIDENSYYEPYSIATTSLTPPHTLTIPLPHSITTKNCKTY